MRTVVEKSLAQMRHPIRHASLPNASVISTGEFGEAELVNERKAFAAPAAGTIPPAPEFSD